MSNITSIHVVNTTTNEKHLLNEPEYIVGRGWLGCKDKRISRQHGIVRIVSANLVQVISTHQNCMFFRKRDDETVSQIENDTEVYLNSGDSFGLLVDEHWFRIQSAMSENDTPCDNGADSVTQPHENGNESQVNSTNGLKRKQSTDSEPDSTNKKVKTEPNEFHCAEAAGEPSSFSNPDGNITAIIVTGNTTSTNEVTNSGSLLNTDENITAILDQIVTESTTSSNEVTYSGTSPNEMPSTSTLTADIPPNVTISAMDIFVPHQPIKIEPVDSNENESQAIKQEPIDSENVDSITVPLPSEVVVKTEVKEEPADNSTEVASSSGTANPAAQRACCRYGIRCYRRNPLHRAQEAHPGDTDYRLPDYGEPPLGAPSCPFLDRCYRRNPLHFQQFSHKAQLGPKKDGYEATVQPPTAQPPTVQQVPVQPPAARLNNVLYNHDDDEEEDPYATDSDDDPYFDAPDTHSESEDTGVFEADTDPDLNGDVE